ncbi:MAG TPA: hypothetical protein VMN82_10075, partial [Thermoanaerobaculia bacterium]|nr:hypothetical protein [Thermoanaerobaculia bacterium]
MTTEPPDARMTRLFEDERAADEATAPAFAELLARSRAPREAGARPRRRVALSAAALAAAAVIVLILRMNARHGRVPEAAGLEPAGIALAHWKAPSDAFLRASGSDLWSRFPVL